MNAPINKQTYVSFFSKQDLFHIIPLSLMFVLGICGYFFGQTTAARVVSGVCSFASVIIESCVLFFIKLPAYKKVKSSISLFNGMSLWLSPESKNININKINDTIYKLIDFWNEKVSSWSLEKIADTLKNTKIYFQDMKFLYLLQDENYRMVGVTFFDNKEIYITTLDRNNEYDENKVISLIRHEVSHIICGYMDVKYMNADVSHQLFKDVELGA